ncbi:MAG: ribokinase [Hyphomicrobiaceae bacterium]|nr:ribokinase [Hyphomicrobiaceae bacterium]
MTDGQGPVLVVGDLMRDIMVHPKGALRRGSDRAADIRILPGGSAGNQAAWLAHFGVPVALLSRVGAADLVTLEAELDGFGIESLLRRDETALSGKLVCIVDPDGERSFFTDRGAGLNLGVEDVEGIEFGRFSAICVSGYLFFSPAGQGLGRSLIAESTRLKIPLFLDPASAGFLEDMGSDAFLGLADGATWLLPNEDEARVLTGFDERWAQLRALSKRFGNVILKCGADGVISDIDDVRFMAPSPKIEAVDTTGAGDAFLAGFLAALRSGDAPPLALDRGARAGAEACMLTGGRPPGSVAF